jgi:sulfur-oxidizing protein SoxX
MRGGGHHPPPALSRSARAPWHVCILVAVAVGGSLAPARAQDVPLRDFTIVDDTIPASLTGEPGNAGRGRAIITNRQTGLCLLCHTGPFPEERFQGNLAPDLRGAGSRWSAAQLRLRLVDSGRLNPDTIMPSYYRVDHLTRVGRAWQGKPVLTAQQIEDVVSFLTTLRD